MKPAALIVSLLLLLLCTTAAHAGEPLPELAGEWVVEQFDGKAPEGLEMRITFVDDDTVRTVMLVDGNVIHEEDMRYEADADGGITTHPANQDEPDAGTWEIKNGKLHLDFPDAGLDGISMVLGRG